LHKSDGGPPAGLGKGVDEGAEESIQSRAGNERCRKRTLFQKIIPVL
jgi:hypothetical protein